MRQLTDIIDAMLVHVPEQESLRHQLLAVHSSAATTAPEMMYNHFSDVVDYLRATCGDDPSAFADWQVEVIKVWVDDQELTRETMIAMMKTKGATNE